MSQERRRATQWRGRKAFKVGARAAPPLLAVSARRAQEDSHQERVAAAGVSLLRCCACRLDRLDYLVSTLRDGGMHWKAALTMPEADWHEMYPAYRDWWAKRGR